MAKRNNYYTTLPKSYAEQMAAGGYKPDNVTPLGTSVKKAHLFRDNPEYQRRVRAAQKFKKKN